MNTLKKIFLGLAVVFTTALTTIPLFTPKTNIKKAEAVNIRQDNKKNRLITIDSSFFDTTNNSIYYFVAKGYDEQGNGYFYNGTADLTHTAVITNTAPYLANKGVNGVSFNIVTNSAISYSTLYYRQFLDNGVYKLRRVWFSNDNTDTYYGESAMYNADTFGFKQENAIFTGQAPFIPLVDSVEYKNDIISFLNQFFDIYITLDYSYSFNNLFNYNAFAQTQNGGTNEQTITTAEYVQIRGLYPFISYGGISYSNIYVHIPMPLFYSAGQVYNEIYVIYAMATTDLYFVDNNGSLITSKLIDNTNPYKFFVSMTYNNTITGVTNTACARLQYLSDNKTIIPYEVTWSNNDYKNIKFFDYPNETQNKFLTMANNNNLIINNGYTGGSNINVGLNNVFSILSQAFTTWLPIFNINIVPGVSLGLLLFMPLVVGIIILVIWLVKR